MENKLLLQEAAASASGTDTQISWCDTLVLVGYFVPRMLTP